MKENILRQKASFLKLHGVPMSAALLEHTVTQLMELQSLYFEDGADCDLNDPKFWERLCPNLHVGVLSLSALLAAGEESRLPDNATEEASISLLIPSLVTVGFAVVPALLKHGEEACGASLNAALCVGLSALLDAGLPPAFLLVYDEAWAVVDSLWGRVAAGLLGGEVCVMEPDINVWHLRRMPQTAERHTDGRPTDELEPDTNDTREVLPPPPPPPSASSYVGQNFGASHRDMRYDHCHDVHTGLPRSLNVWHALNASGATYQNGAMRVVPIPLDPLFRRPLHPGHMSTGAGDEAEHYRSSAVVLLAPPGSTCVWTPSAVHWGGGCDFDAKDEPRASVAATFRIKATSRSAYGAADDGDGPNTAATAGDADSQPQAPPSGPPPLDRNDLNDLPLSRRLAFAAKAILAYSHWYPGFPSLDLSLLSSPRTTATTTTAATTTAATTTTTPE